jgi:hypothetical protein
MTAAMAVAVYVADTTTRAPLAGHLGHLAAAIAFLVLTIGGVAAGERPKRQRQAPPQDSRQSSLLPVIAVAGVGAAAVHFVVMPTHVAEAMLYGVFFAFTATTQLGYSVLLLLRPSRPLVATGVVGNLAMVALWLVTRIVAIPLGPAAGSTEPFGALDILASSFETIVVVAGMMTLLRTPLPTRSVIRSLATPQVALLTISAVVAVTTTAYLAPPS